MNALPWTTGTLLAVWIGFWSAAAVILTISDKLRAKRRRWRIPENTLLLVSALGGSAAMLLVMLLIRHKTRHPKFMVGIPLMIALQIPAVLWILLKGSGRLPL